MQKMPEPSYKEILQKSWKMLLKHVDPELLMDLLRARSFISREDEEHILASQEQTAQARRLLDVVSSKGQSRLKEFFHILREENPYAYSLVQREVLHKYPSADLPQGKQSSLPVP